MRDFAVGVAQVVLGVALYVALCAFGVALWLLPMAPALLASYFGAASWLVSALTLAYFIVLFGMLVQASRDPRPTSS